MDSVSLVCCQLCGRRLIVAGSVARGVGPVCFRKQNAAEIAAAVAEDRPVLNALAGSGPGLEAVEELEDDYDEDTILVPTLS